LSQNDYFFYKTKWSYKYHLSSNIKIVFCFCHFIHRCFCHTHSFISPLSFFYTFLNFVHLFRDHRCWYFAQNWLLKFWKNRGTWEYIVAWFWFIFWKFATRNIVTFGFEIVAQWLEIVARFVEIWNVYKSSFFTFSRVLQEKETWETKWGNFVVECL